MFSVHLLTIVSLTPIKTITDAYVKLLDDDSLYGQAIEGSVEKHLFFPDPPMVNGAATKRAVTVWDPLFEMLHGHTSGYVSRGKPLHLRVRH